MATRLARAVRTGHNLDRLRVSPSSSGQWPSPAGGRSLPASLRERMEASFGTSFADVRIHEGDQAASIGTYAFTSGQQIHLMPGLYQPHTELGRSLLGHELAHVVQQRLGRVAQPHSGEGPLNTSADLEAEADRLGQQAAGHDGPSAGPSMQADACKPADQAASAASGPGQVAQGVRIINLGGFDIDLDREEVAEDLLQELFNITYARQEALASTAEAQEKVKYRPLAQAPSIPGLPAKVAAEDPENFDVGPQNYIDGLLLARKYAENNPERPFKVTFHAQGAYKGTVLRHPVTFAPARLGWLVTGLGAYSPKQEKEQEHAVEQALEGEAGEAGGNVATGSSATAKRKRTTSDPPIPVPTAPAVTDTTNKRVRTTEPSIGEGEAEQGTVIGRETELAEQRELARYVGLLRAEAAEAEKGKEIQEEADTPPPALSDVATWIGPQRGRSLLKIQHDLVRFAAKRRVSLAKRGSDIQPKDFREGYTDVARALGQFFTVRSAKFPKSLQVSEPLSKLVNVVSLGFTEGLRNIQAFPIAAITERLFKHGEDFRPYYEGDSPLYPPANSGTEQKLRAIHVYYARQRKDLEGNEPAALANAKDVHDKMKDILRRYFSIRSVTKKSLPRALAFWRAHEGREPKTWEDLRRIFGLLLQHKFLRSVNLPKRD